MQPLIAIRAVLIAFALTVVSLATAAYADVGSIRFNVLKAGFVIGSTHHWRGELRLYLWRLVD
jgi:hypothetical protein